MDNTRPESLTMLLVSDVHAEFDALRKVARRGEPLCVLGDLINFVDYRTCEGILSDVLGVDVVAQMVEARGAGDYARSRDLWNSETEGRRDEVRAEIADLVRRQYREVTAALEGTETYVTFGNVDWPDLLRDSLPEGSTFVDGDVREIEGRRVGFVGGGAPSPLGVPGEVADDEIRLKLETLGPVDILCTHMAPSVRPLHYDVVAGREQGSSKAILDYLISHQPKYHYFGDIHQPQASRWRIKRTRSMNVGYFRATRRALAHEPD